MKNTSSFYNLIVITIFCMLMNGCEAIPSFDRGDITIKYNELQNQLELEIENGTGGNFNYQNQPCDYASEWYEIRKIRYASDNILYYNEFLITDNNAWSIPVEWLNYTYFGFGSRWYWIQGSYLPCDDIYSVFTSSVGKDYYRLTDGELLYHPFLDTALYRYNVPYVLGTSTDQLGDNVSKTDNNGLTCLDCSGLVVWSLVKNNVDLFINGSERHIVGQINVNKLWEICRDHYFLSIPINSWQDGNLIFLDSNQNGTPDHVMFWTQDYESSSPYGWVVHSRGGDTQHDINDPALERGKVVFQPLPELYINNGWYFDGGYIPETTMISKN